MISSTDGINEAAITMDAGPAWRPEQFHRLESLYRRERVFILQRQRVVLDDMFRELRKREQELAALRRKQPTSSVSQEICALGEQQAKLGSEFMDTLAAANNFAVYSNE